MADELKCIHSERGQKCNRPAFPIRTNGWLCFEHYRQQQLSMPPRPRKPQPKWKGLPLTRDEDIIEDILDLDERLIATRPVQRKRFGAIEPLFMRLQDKQIY